jgi:hypothetical protein
MTVFDVKGNVGDSGEYILGAEQTGSHACYVIYGIMKPHEKGRELKPGKGHEGQAIHLRGDETAWLENASGAEAVYVISGGHADGGHH